MAFAIILDLLSWNPILMYKKNDSLPFRSVDFDPFNDDMTHSRHYWYTEWRHFRPVHWLNESFSPYIRIGFLLSRNKNMKPKVMWFENQVFRQMQQNLISDKKYSASKKFVFGIYIPNYLCLLKDEFYRNLSRTVLTNRR